MATERKGARYKITEKHKGYTHADHTQRTNATVASEMYAPVTHTPGPEHGPSLSDVRMNTLGPWEQAQYEEVSRAHAIKQQRRT